MSRLVSTQALAVKRESDGNARESEKALSVLFEIFANLVTKKIGEYIKS